MLLLLFLHLLFPLINGNCSISRFSRRTCSRNNIYLDSKSCLAAGCCYDRQPGIPSKGRCYKKSSSDSEFSIFKFSATKPPSYNANINVYSYGGSVGYPGSQVMFICDYKTPCKQLLTYSAYRDKSGECIRRGCCWKEGKCFENRIRILYLRDSCPPGYKNPPKCEAIMACDDQPCLNGGLCIPTTGSNNFICKCPQGFDGDICGSNCPIPNLLNAVVEPSTIDAYKHGVVITLKCAPDYEVVAGTESIRTCVNGEFSPSLITSPFKCLKSALKVDFLMVFSSSVDLDDCNNLASQLGASPYTQNQLQSVNALNFNLQLNVLEQIETLYKQNDHPSAQFAYYANEKPCSKSDLKRSLSQTNLIDTTSLLQAQKYTCSSENLLDIIVCANEYTYIPEEDNPNSLNVMIYINGGENSNVLQYIQLAEYIRNNPDYAFYRDTVIIILDYLPRSDRLFDNSELYFNAFIGDEASPFKGRFIGSIHDPIDTIMTEIRKVIDAFN